MTKLKKDLQQVTKQLKALTKKTESLAKAVDKLEKAQTAKKSKTATKPKTTKKKAPKKSTAKKKPSSKKATKGSPTDQVLNIIKRSKKGVHVSTLMTKTGFGEGSVRNIVYKATKAGKIKRTGRGVYVGV